MEPYPLHWPLGYTRTKEPKSAQFRTTFGKARDGLLYQLNKLKADDILISSDVPVGKDGLPKASYKALTQHGVAVYFAFKGQRRVLCCDKWDDVVDNLQALMKTVEAMRGMERWGVAEMLDRSFVGFHPQLPAPDQVRPWHEVLGVGVGSYDDVVHKAYKRLALLNHPDKGGVYQVFQRIQDAYSRFKKERGIV